MPQDNYTSDTEGYQWNAPEYPRNLYPVQQPTYLVNHREFARERRLERRATTGRIVLALFAAIPLTGIAACISSFALVQLVAIGMTWAGILAVLWVMTGMPNPFKKD